jgi:hypothetical protein
MRQDAAFFEGRNPVLVYIAKRLKEALRIEGLFTAAGLDYGVEADDYRGGIIFRTTRTGAFFYVLPEAAPTAQELLRRHGYAPHENGFDLD